MSDLVAYAGSSVGWVLNEYSSWTRVAYFDVGLDFYPNPCIIPYTV